MENKRRDASETMSILLQSPEGQGRIVPRSDGPENKCLVISWWLSQNINSLSLLNFPLQGCMKYIQGNISAFV